jgi:hypothetical protein
VRVRTGDGGLFIGGQIAARSDGTLAVGRWRKLIALHNSMSAAMQPVMNKPRKKKPDRKGTLAGRVTGMGMILQMGAARALFPEVCPES